MGKFECEMNENEKHLKITQATLFEKNLKNLTFFESFREDRVVAPQFFLQFLSTI